MLQGIPKTGGEEREAASFRTEWGFPRAQCGRLQPAVEQHNVWPLLSLRDRKMVESPLEKEDILKQLPIPSRQFPDPPETQTGPGSLLPAEMHRSPITSGYRGSEPRLGLGCLD